MKKIFMIRVLTTLIGWAIAFVIVYTMIFLFGEELKLLPPAVTALIFSGVLVTIMGNVVMPKLTKVITEFVEKKGGRK